MKRIVLVLIIVATTLKVNADNWTQKASIGTRYLRFPTGFSIGNKGYVCGGGDSTNNLTAALWEFDPTSNIWTQKADYGGGLTSVLATFVLQGKAYAGLGENNISAIHNDWWQYDPITNVWTQKADYGGGKRAAAFSFSINNLGYVSGGQDSTGTLHNDLWEYNPVSDSWTQKANCPIIGSIEGVSFSIGNKGYLGGGISFATPLFTTTFWEYDPLIDNWTQKANIPVSQFLDNGSFSIGNYGYVTCGESPQIFPNNYFTTLWQYNPLLNHWVTKASFPGQSRDEVATFSIGNHGYVGLGGKDGNPLYNDFYEYTPDSLEMIGINEIINHQTTITLSPNPFTSQTSLSFGEEQTNTTVIITNLLGEEIKTIPHVHTQQLVIDKGEMKPGIYFVQTIDDAKRICNKKMVVE